jgi:hypothetical protein
MPDFDLPPEPASQPDTQARLNALQKSHDSLRNSFHLTLVLLLILTGALFASFLREVSIARRHIHDLTLVVAEYQKNSLPVIEDLQRKLQIFIQAHPDFTPVYYKYFSATNAPSTGQQWPQAPAETNPVVRLPPAQQ